MPHRVYVGLGSNLGDRKANIREAEQRLVELPDTRIVKASSLYESEPHGNAKTWFVNSVIEIETEFPPDQLLRQEAAERVGDDDRRLGQSREGALQIVAAIRKPRRA